MTTPQRLPRGLVRDKAGRFYWVKRVPGRFVGLVLGRDGQPVSQVRVCLRTDSLEVARLKAPQVEAARMAEWEALASGDGPDARAHYLAARALAEARGFSYRPAADLMAGDLADLVARLLSLNEGQGMASPAVAEAVLGLVPEVLPDLREVLEEYFSLTETRGINKSPAQAKRWRARRLRAVEHFCEATQTPRPDGSFPAPPVSQIDRAAALKFRDWCAARVAEGQAIDTQNKDIGSLSDVLKTWAAMTGAVLENPFQGLRLEGRDLGRRPPFTRAQLAAVLAGLDGLNAEARDVVAILCNTGARPSEVLGARLADFALAAPVPYLDICQYRGRELKQAHTARAVPLVGIALPAAARIVARGGLSRYAHKGDAFSAVVNKFMTENGLRPTPGHSVYSIRHYVEDALLDAGVDDRIRADILGHEYGRPSYGEGGALVGRRAALERIAF